jgi:cobalt-zinc-cadmium efflux system membrane fusion protein
MTSNRHWLLTGVAVIAALGIGFGGSQLLMRPTTTPDAHAEGEGHADGADGVIALAAKDAEAAGVQITTVERGGGSELLLPGRVEFAPGAEAIVDAPLPGAVVQVHVGVGSRVAKGAALVTLRSPEGAASRATTDAAAASVDAARAAERRDRSLFERGYVARARLDITEAEARRAEAELRAARARVSAYGAPRADGLVVVRSPISGVVTRLATRAGQVLHEEDQEVAAVADAGQVDMVFEAPPAASTLLHVGDKVTASDALGQSVSGVVVAIAPANVTGVVTIRARADGATPPAGAILSARIASGTATGALVVPSEAVQTVAGVQSVFVVDGAGFRARPVVVGRTADGRTEILRGLSGSERIAGVGAFLLKAELAKGEAAHED